MSGVTLEEIWQLVLPAGTRVVAGEGAFSREVTWPVVQRTQPPAFTHLRGGELALISTASLRLLDENVTLPQAIRSLAEMGVSAIAVLGDIPGEAGDAAAALGIPLLALPPDTDLHELERSITRALYDRRAALYQHSQEIHRQLTHLAIEGRGISAIVSQAAQITGKAAAMQDESFELRSYSGQELEREEAAALLAKGKVELLRWLRRVALNGPEPPTVKLELTARGVACLVAPILVKGGVQGYFSILGQDKMLGERDCLTVTHAAAACAIDLARERAVLEAEDRIQTDFLEELLTREFPSAEAIVNRGKRWGWDLSRPHVAMVFRLAASVGPLAELGRLTQREMARRGTAAPVKIGRGTATLLYPLLGKTEASQSRPVAEEIKRELATWFGEASVSVGIGGYHPGVEGLKVSYREAEQAVAIGARLFGPGHVTCFDDLGLYRLLFALENTEELRAFYQTMLGPLVAYDRKKGTELVKTLEAYLVSLGSPTEAAQSLHLHRNTLLYRLRRIREITGLDLAQAEVRLALHLALRARQVLEALP